MSLLNTIFIVLLVKFEPSSILIYKVSPRAIAAPEPAVRVMLTEPLVRALPAEVAVKSTNAPLYDEATAVETSKFIEVFIFMFVALSLAL